MADNRPGLPDRKLGLIAPLSIAAVALVVLGAALLANRRSTAPPDAVPPAPAAAPPTKALPPSPAAPSAEPIVTRPDLLKAANALAAAYADADVPAAPGEGPQPGRRFALRIPFGCDGPQPRAGSAQELYEFDPERRTMRLVARPADWTTLPLIQQADFRDQLEAVEGFWIPRPWAHAEHCPPPAEAGHPAAPTPPAAETVGLARLFERGGSRIGRRERRPYEQVVKLGVGEGPPQQDGYRLVLEGRLGAFPDGRAARCWSESAAHRPVCIYAVEFDRVAFETGDGRLLAEWRD